MTYYVGQHAINIEVKCQITETEIKALSELLGSCYTRVFPTGTNLLSKVIIVENDMIEVEVNRILTDTGIDGFYKRASANAVAVPLLHNGEFYSVIVFGRSEIPNNPDEYTFSNISSFLEELLHVKLYEETFGDIEFKPKDSVQIIARMTIDEYVVNRWKYSIITELFGPLGYNEELIPQFTELDDKFLRLVLDAAHGITTIDEACNELLRITYRDFLEPLTRYFSGYDCIEGIPEIPLGKYPFFYDVAYRYWKQINKELKACFDNIENFDKHVNAITAIIADFFRAIGVTYKETPEGFYYNFDSSILMRYKMLRS